MRSAPTAHVHAGRIKFEIVHAGRVGLRQRLGETRLSARQLPTVLDAREDMRGFAPVGDENGAVIPAFFARLVSRLNSRLESVVMVMNVFPVDICINVTTLRNPARLAV